MKKCLNCKKELREKNWFGVFCTECCRIQYFNKKEDK